ncbi:hypothetical protein KUTeg_005343, partial [Tegillarca granosa]
MNEERGNNSETEEEKTDEKITKTRETITKINNNNNNESSSEIQLKPKLSFGISRILDNSPESGRTTPEEEDGENSDNNDERENENSSPYDSVTNSKYSDMSPNFSRSHLIGGLPSSSLGLFGDPNLIKIPIHRPHPVIPYVVIVWHDGMDGFSSRQICGRIGHPYQNRTPPKRKKPRTSFSRLQIMELEKRFHRQKYLASAERSALAKALKMTDAQVKTWFQNRRTKW